MNVHMSYENVSSGYPKLAQLSKIAIGSTSGSDVILGPDPVQNDLVTVFFNSAIDPGNSLLPLIPNDLFFYLFLLMETMTEQADQK